MTNRYSKSLAIGNTGENYVAYQLSRFCIVRPVAGGTDIGIDLYCELPLYEKVSDVSTYLHFGVQVKTGASYKNHVTIKQDQRDYYKMLRFPLIIAVLPDIPNVVQSECGIMVIDYSKMLSDSAEGIIQENELNRISREHYEEFQNHEEFKNRIRAAVEIATVRLDYKHGVLRPIPSTQNSYFKNYYHKGSHHYNKQAYDTITKTASNMIISYFDNRAQPSELDPGIQRLAMILEAANDINHWDSMFALGIYYHASREYVRSKKYFLTSMKVIRDDPGTREMPYSLEFDGILKYITEIIEIADKSEIPMRANSLNDTYES